MRNWTLRPTASKEARRFDLRRALYPEARFERKMIRYLRHAFLPNGVLFDDHAGSCEKVVECSDRQADWAGTLREGEVVAHMFSRGRRDSRYALVRS